jgi:hypothetical protein
MALYGFKGVGWYVSTLAFALGGYLIMSHGAAERARLQGLENRIVDARKDIRNLETEFSTRANLAQLEKWNGEAIGMSAPVPQQFAQGEVALASLGAMPEPEPGAVIQQAAVTPSAAPRPQAAVAIAAVDPARTTPAASTIAPQGRASSGSTAPTVAASGARPANRAVAMVDQRQLLSSSTMGDLERRAVSERASMQ